MSGSTFDAQYKAHLLLRYFLLRESAGQRMWIKLTIAAVFMCAGFVLEAVDPERNLVLLMMGPVLIACAAALDYRVMRRWDDEIARWYSGPDYAPHWPPPPPPPGKK